MRRRAPKVEGVVPERLATFKLEEWSTSDGLPSSAYVLWSEARREWTRAHGWPGGELLRDQEELAAIIALPDDPFDPETI